MSVVFELCWVVHSAMDVDTSDESSDEKIFRFALEDDDSDFITGIYALEDDDSDFITGMFLYANNHDRTRSYMI